MIEQGLQQEVKALVAAGYTKDSPGLKAIGYQEWFEYKDKERVCQAIIHNTRKYAKKQYTLIRDIPGSIIVPFSGSKDIYKVYEILKEKFT